MDVRNWFNLHRGLSQTKTMHHFNVDEIEKGVLEMHAGNALNPRKPLHILKEKSLTIGKYYRHGGNKTYLYTLATEN